MPRSFSLRPVPNELNGEERKFESSGEAESASSGSVGAALVVVPFASGGVRRSFRRGD
jgi:hypothetical protein